MKRLHILTYLGVLAVFTPSVDALTGDLDLDGDVDFDDFFIFADQFGKEGPVTHAGVDTVFVTQRDTLERIIEREITIRDTIVQTLLDTLYETNGNITDNCGNEIALPSETGELVGTVNGLASIGGSLSTQKLGRRYRRRRSKGGLQPER